MLPYGLSCGKIVDATTLSEFGCDVIVIIIVIVVGVIIGVHVVTYLADFSVQKLWGRWTYVRFG